MWVRVLVLLLVVAIDAASQVTLHQELLRESCRSLGFEPGVESVVIQRDQLFGLLGLIFELHAPIRVKGKYFSVPFPTLFRKKRWKKEKSMYL